MADDLQIKPQANSNLSATTQAAAPQSQAQNQTTPPQVIDLRNMDQKPATAAATTATSAKPAATTAAAPSTSTQDNSSFTAASGKTYAVPEMVKTKFPDLVQLIKETESMNDEEREYWFQIMPIMTEDQILKFREILVNEKDQLSKLDKEYESELTKLNEKHMIEWKDFETKEKRKALTQAEQKSKADEKSTEEDLLQRLSQV
ncbi:MAG: hypothetical protein WC843_03440 [Candidatus Gracilibacteria bacterium]|jgi:hypothetical protein